MQVKKILEWKIPYKKILFCPRVYLSYVTSTILALCVISFVHIFLFPLYDLNAGRSPSKTYMDFEQTLCASNLNIKHHHHHSSSKKWGLSARHCPQYGIVTAMQGGRLGNQMWEYASVWALARRTGLEPYVPRCIRLKLDQLFDALSVPTFDEIAHCPVELNSFVKSLNTWNYTNQSILLPRYSFHIELVVTWVQDIVQEFSIKKKLLEKSQQILRLAARNITSSSGSSISSKIFVGVHVRRQDYIAYLTRKRPSVSPANAMFFKSAMRHFEVKFAEDGVVFVVVSDDPLWCRRKFGRMRNVYFTSSRNRRNSPALDLAILASCNHSIFDYGTFGEWGAILAGGETIYYNLSQYSSQALGQLLHNWHSAI